MFAMNLEQVAYFAKELGFDAEIDGDKMEAIFCDYTLGARLVFARVRLI